MPRRRAVTLVLAVLLVAGGLAAILTAGTAQRTAPQPPPAGAGVPTWTITPDTPMPSARPPARDLPRSRPTSISIPAIDVQSSLLALGLNPDGSIAVPAEGADYDKAAWYKYSPTPGQVGPTVIEGHIDSAENGPSVFFRLGDLRRGDTTTVTRADGTATVFTVDKVARVPKARFPTGGVYGGTPDPQLRLITCGGAFDSSEGSYVDNIVAYGHLTATRPAA